MIEPKEKQPHCSKKNEDEEKPIKAYEQRMVFPGIIPLIRLNKSQKTH
jgi:hypothetical protein